MKSITWARNQSLRTDLIWKNFLLYCAAGTNIFKVNQWNGLFSKFAQILVDFRLFMNGTRMVLFVKKYNKYIWNCPEFWQDESYEILRIQKKIFEAHCKSLSWWTYLPRLANEIKPNFGFIAQTEMSETIFGCCHLSIW